MKLLKVDLDQDKKSNTKLKNNKQEEVAIKVIAIIT